MEILDAEKPTDASAIPSGAGAAATAQVVFVPVTPDLIASMESMEFRGFSHTLFNDFLQTLERLAPVHETFAFPLLSFFKPDKESIAEFATRAPLVVASLERIALEDINGVARVMLLSAKRELNQALELNGNSGEWKPESGIHLQVARNLLSVGMKMA